jgi:RIO-like serine/threonine protein kinase
MAHRELLKKDLFGEIRFEQEADALAIVRDATVAKTWIRWLSRALLRREARALAILDDVDGVPGIIRLERTKLVREFVPGEPLHVSRSSDPDYYRRAARLLRSLHRHCIVHNDLAKEPNLLVRDDGTPALVDFQLALYAPRRGRLFRLLAWDDIRHLIKHKRSYCPDRLTGRELGILETPSLPSRLFRNTVKPVYVFVTRRILGWADREGAADRGAHR